MYEPNSCDNCKYSYVDNLFYEWQCRVAPMPYLDKDGDPVESNDCKYWEEE